MNIRKIVAELHRQHNRIDSAITAIEALSPDRAKPIRPSASRSTPRRRRRISAAARRKLSALMKARWVSGKIGKAKKKVKA